MGASNFNDSAILLQEMINKQLLHPRKSRNGCKPALICIFSLMEHANYRWLTNDGFKFRSKTRVCIKMAGKTNALLESYDCDIDWLQKHLSTLWPCWIQHLTRIYLKRHTCYCTLVNLRNSLTAKLNVLIVSIFLRLSRAVASFSKHRLSFWFARIYLFLFFVH